MGASVKVKKTEHWSFEKDLRRMKNKINTLSNIITKIVMGRAENARHKYKPGTVICKKRSSGVLEFFGYTGNGIAKIYIFCEDENMDYIISQLEGL
jgi:hypothetical protein